MPLDSYLVGLLLGNGGMTRPHDVRFTSCDKELVLSLRETVPAGSGIRYEGLGNYAVSKACSTESLRSITKRLGMTSLSTGKSIPESYLWTSAANRLALLQGLMDTDGSVDLLGRAEYCTTSHQLAKDVQFLVQSLGGKTRICPRTNVHYTSPTQSIPKSASDAYILRNIRFPPGSGLNPFRLSRKASRYAGKKHGLMRGWGVERIEPCGETETVCISVSAPSCLYLTENFIPTHNTGGPSDTDGDGVYAKSRPVGACVYVRWADVAGNAAAPPESEVRYVKVFSHNGIHSMLLRDKQFTVTGIKVNGVPFGPGEILVAYREEA